MSISSIFSLHTQFYLCVAVSYVHISLLKAHMYIYASIFTRGRTRHFARRTPIYTGWARCVPYSRRAFVDDFQKMERAETTRRRNEGVKKAWVGDGVGGKKKRKGAKEKKKKKKQRVHLSSLDFLGIPCVFSLEQRPGNLIPFSIYLNPFTQTPLPTSSTFRLFLLFSACLPSAAVTSHPYSFSVAWLPSIWVRRAKGGTRFRHFLPLLRMLHCESSPRSWIKFRWRKWERSLAE